MSETDTERVQLISMGAQYLADLWFKLYFPLTYASTRLVNGHQIAVIVCNGETARKLMEQIESESLTLRPG